MEEPATPFILTLSTLPGVRACYVHHVLAHVDTGAVYVVPTCGTPHHRICLRNLTPTGLTRHYDVLGMMLYSVHNDTFFLILFLKIMINYNFT